jgi:glycosyltransferase involved in cell wall biosynthesis
MKITFVLPDASYAGGVRVVATYASKLQARGHRVTVISTPRQTASLKTKLRSLLRGQGWPVEKSGSHMDHAAVEHRIIDRRRPVTDADTPDADVVIATWWETAEWVANLSAAKGAKVYFLQHDETLFASSPERALATWSLPMSKIAVAQWLANLAEARSPGSADEITLVPNSVDHSQFHAQPRGKQPAFTVGFMYSRARFKACDVTIAAIELARKRLDAVNVLSFGIPEPDQMLPLPAGTRYVRQPAQHLIRDIYSACDAWIVASRSEGFGLPILEAMACRTPVIATTTGAAPELLSEGGGMIVKPEDPSDLSRAIEQMARMDDATWRSMSHAACTTAGKYTWEHATDLFEAALERAVAAHSCSAA